MEYLIFQISITTILFSQVCSYITLSPSGLPSNTNLDYCTKFCETEDSLCDTINGRCICHPGILHIPQPNIPFKRRSLLWFCQNDDICKKWCYSDDSYCDDGVCICHPCGEIAF
ncbi:hypothetical protein R6Q57_014810 [Mikania cordata]